MNKFRRLVRQLASVKLAVFIIAGLAVLIAAGTFVEAHYNDAQAASKYVYRTPYMFALMGILAINLIAVMVDRWPWQKRHRSFVAAHIGILVLLLGSWMTMEYGLDGNLVIPIGGSNRWVQLPETELTVWSTFDGSNYSKIYEKTVDFMVDDPAKSPISIPTDEGALKVTGFRPYVYASNRVVASSTESGPPAVRFHIHNDRASVNEWLFQERAGQPAVAAMGPARIYLATDFPANPKENEIYLVPDGDGLKYKIFYRDGKLPRSGVLKEGDEIETGWMGLLFRVLRYYPRAERAWDFEDSSHRSELTTSVIELEWDGKKRWVSLGDRFKIFTKKAAYLVNYSNKVMDVGFDVKLRKFEMGKYQGTERAASYKSIVEVPELGEREISMNAPLKHLGKTLYQASFSNNEEGQAVASVLSVNDDPGRWVKYLGSLIITLGVIWLFWDRRKSARAAIGPRENKVGGPGAGREKT